MKRIKEGREGERRKESEEREEEGGGREIIQVKGEKQTIDVCLVIVVSS